MWGVGSWLPYPALEFPREQGRVRLCFYCPVPLPLPTLILFSGFQKETKKYEAFTIVSPPLKEQVEITRQGQV